MSNNKRSLIGSDPLWLFEVALVNMLVGQQAADRIHRVLLSMLPSKETYISEDACITKLKDLIASKGFVFYLLVRRLRCDFVSPW